ncbi:MAG: CdaR family protein [bacterium]
MKIISLLRSFVLNNWLAKLVCLLFAVGLWAWVVVQQSAERAVNVQINFHEIPEDHVLGEQTDREVRITLRGPQTRINTIEAADVAVDVNLSGLSAGMERIQILPWHVHKPKGIEVVEITPRSIQVALVERVEKVVEVRPGLAGERLEKYDYKINLKPDTAVITGPREQIDGISELYLTRLNLPAPEDPQVEATVEAVLPRGIKLKRPEQNAFFVEIAVHEETVKQVIEDVPVEVENSSGTDSIVVEPEKIDVEIRGKSEQVESITAADIRATVTAGVEAGESRLQKVNLVVPDGVELTEKAEEEITVRVERMEQ